MANKFEDVLRTHKTPANLSADLKDLMFGYDITNDRFASKIAGGTMKWVSDDTQQVLIAGTQTITGLKTFSLNVIMTAAKLLTLDQVGGLRLKTASINTISDNDALYTAAKLLGIFGGDLEVLDHGQLEVGANVNFISNGSFGSGSDWTLAGDFAIGSGTLNYTDSAGSGTAEQAVADYLVRAIEGETYRLLYDVTAFTGDAVVQIHTDTVATAITLDMAVGTLKEAFFKIKSSSTKFKISVTSTTGSFSMDNFTMARVGGVVNAKSFGPSGLVDISGEGDIELSEPLGIRSGWIGGPLSTLLRNGIQFSSSGDVRMSTALDIGDGGGNDFPDKDTERMSIEKVGTGQTIGAVTVDIDFLIDGNNNFGSTYLIIVNGADADGSKVFSQIMYMGLKKTGGTLSNGGTVGLQEIDPFGAVSIALSVSGSSLRVTPTGQAGDTINWTIGLIGVGAQMGKRT